LPTGVLAWQSRLKLDTLVLFSQVIAMSMQEFESRAKVIIVASALALFSGSVSFAQYQAPSSMQGKTILIPAGTTFEGRIQETIGSSVSRQSQRFTVLMDSPLLANGNDVLIPSGTEVIGEVVEAVAGDHVPHDKGTVKPIGKLRVKLTSLKTPDGMTYPLVASLAPDKLGRNSQQQQPLGSGVAYVGGQSNFEAVAPRAAQQRRGQGPQVVTRDQLMKDPLYGRQANNNNNDQDAAIRSLVRKKRNLFIYSGSPLTMRIEAPLKMGYAAAQSAPATLEPPVSISDPSRPSGRRRFIKGNDADNSGNLSDGVPGTDNAQGNPAQKNGGTAQPPKGRHDPNDSEF
jgi:hypothetical protein